MPSAAYPPRLCNRSPKRSEVRNGFDRMIRERQRGAAGPVRFATFNLENLFARPKVFNLATWAEGEPILKASRSSTR